MIRKILACSLLILAGCATLGIPAPKSFGERVAAAYTGLSITNDTATILVNAGTVSKEDGREVLAKTKAARETVDTASTLSGQLGENALTDALELLRAAQDLLCGDRPTEPNCAYLMQRSRP